MLGAEIDSVSVNQYRRFYAEELRVVSNLSSQALVSALGRVEREKFLGPPPWRFAGNSFLKPSSYSTTDDPRDLYHDIVVALKTEHGLNNGQPSIVASSIAAMSVDPGDRVLHIGCATGYYTAILAEVTGAEGSVVAVEVDADLAAQAELNLRTYAHVEVIQGDAATMDFGPREAILVSAGVTQPRLAWLHSLTQGGSLVLPLTVATTPRHGRGLIVKITRSGDRFVAEPCAPVAIYSSTSSRDPAMEVQLKESLESGDLLKLQSVRTDQHERSASCLAHSSTVCLSAASLPLAEPAPAD